MDSEHFESAKAYIGFDSRSARLLREFHGVAEPAFEPIAEDFYDAIARQPRARAALTGGAPQIERLKTTLKAWLSDGLTGPHDEAYLKRRLRIGDVHVRIELPQEFMFTAMNRVRSGLITRARDKLEEPLCAATVEALNQLLDLELAIMLDSYRENWLARVRRNEHLATLGQFAGSIGHELRNPLGIVDSSVFLMSQRLKQLGNDDPTLQKHLKRIAEQTESCGQTISSLLELARDNPPKRTLVNLKAFVEQGLAALALPESLALELHVDENIELALDPAQLRRVLTNLIDNAVEALKGSGRLWIRTETTSEAVSLIVEDDGPGVPPDLRDRIFDLWFTTKATGTGVGLALSRKIVEAHGGTIAIDDSPQGARFRIGLPRD